MNDRGGDRGPGREAPRGRVAAGSAGDADVHVPFTYRLRFTRDAFDPADATLAQVIERGEDRPARTIILVDHGVLDAWPALPSMIDRYLEAHADVAQRAGAIEPITGGEAAKNDANVVELTQRLINEHGICRQSYVLAIGGGAMLDAVGYGAATAHRGVRLIRLPTTTLAQGDAGIGVKNGINAFGKKNFLGSFAVPWAVINDSQFLMTLTDRDWRCGLSEAVKVALVKDEAYFARIEEAATQLRRRDEIALAPILEHCAKLHLKHIIEGGDPFELTTARPLDFGHWSAHKLEQMTRFDLRHGEAVAIGIAIDVMYSAMEGMLGDADAQRIFNCLASLGFELSHPALAHDDRLLEGLEEFREHLGGRLTIALLGGIGRQIDVHEIDRPMMSRAIGRVRGLSLPAAR